MAYLRGLISVIGCFATLAYGLQSEFHQNVYVICNFLLNKLSRIFLLELFRERKRDHEPQQNSAPLVTHVNSKDYQSQMSNINSVN